MALKQMKILIMDIVKPLGRDGSTIHRWEVARNLAKFGCGVHAFSYTDMGSEEGLHIYQLPKKSKIKYIIQLLKLVMKNHFDIVYTRNIMKGIIGLLIKKLWKSKLVVEVNSISPDERRLVENYLSTTRKSLKDIKIKFFGYLEIFISKKADAVIAVTQGIKSYLVNHGVNENKVWVIENGANTELFKPIKNSNVTNELKNRLHINNDESVVLFVGVLEPWQGVEYLIYAAPLIIKEIPKTKFLIVGEGAMKEKLKFLSKELNIGQNVIFTGTVPYENVPEYINISDACVAPFTRIRNESMGLSPLKIYEYLACAKPVVASDIKGVGDLLANSNSGIAVIPEDPAELANAIIKLLKDKQLREQMGDNGRKLVVKNYSWEITARKTAGVFKKLYTKIDQMTA